MARAYEEYNPERDGSLEIAEISSSKVVVYLNPPEREELDNSLTITKKKFERVKLLEINSDTSSLIIFPLFTIQNNSEYLQPKYGRIKRIIIDDFHVDIPGSEVDVINILEYLPSAFIKDYAYGLGFAKPYRFIADAVQELSDCNEIVISKTHETGPCDDATIFYISKKDFEKARLLMNSIGNLGQAAVREVRSAAAHNLIAERIGAEKIKPQIGRHPYRKLITAAALGKEELSEEDQEELIRVVSNHAAELVDDKPEKLAKLRGDIELVTLEKLTQQYKAMLGKNLNEDRWQAFFNENPFILNMAFGYPVIKVRDQASVGGRKLSGDGEKITDFLVKNSLTNNTALFEIKTPSTQVLQKKEFRDEVYTPSSDLSGSINQALDQKYQFQKQIAQIKENTRTYDIESYAVHCCLVIGRTPEGEDRLKSFELFRRNSKDVEIVTFDELLEKLKQLAAFLRSTENGGAGRNLSILMKVVPVTKATYL